MLGRKNYEAYARATGGKSLATGDNLPGWEQLPEAIQAAWEASAADYLKVRTALENLVHCKTRDELEQMEAAVRSIRNIPDATRVLTINALTALIETL